MKDYLLDLVNHTVPVGDAFQHIKIVGTDKETKLQSTDVSKRVILKATAKEPIPEFEGKFGIPNLAQLNTILKIPVYEENPSITMVREDRNGDKVLTEIHFESSEGAFENRFRLLGASVIDSKEKDLNSKINEWPIEFEPSAESHKKLQYQSSANPEEIAVEFSVKKGVIEAKLGDDSNHNGKFVFQNNVDKDLNYKIYIPIQIMLSILKLTGDRTIFMNNLAMMIRIDSGIFQYDFIIPSLAK